MSANISFESNVFPVIGSISTDNNFLSKIWDFNRLRALDNNRQLSFPFSPLQRKIIREQPTCALNKEDPCWGMMETSTGYHWVCMCTKTECTYFTSCRSKLPFDAEKEHDFIPQLDLPDEYGYYQFAADYSPSPVLIGDSTEYSALQSFGRNGTSSTQKFSPFQQLLKRDSDSSQQISEPDAQDEQTPLADNPMPAAEELTAEDPSVPEIDIHSTNLNVFNYFSECSQSDIITASPNENFFVDAGPGTGKTYTLIQKLNYLVNEEGVEADGILVLCFTHAAVDEVKSRLRQFVNNGADRSLVNVDVRTFHSFAWWLINQANTVLTDRGWTPIAMRNLSYDMSLKKASAIVSKYGEDVVGNWEYFIVDEVQDLTNTLGYFVLKIINACLAANCGVTVLGDACQAIYDYDQDASSATLKSTEFYKALFRKMYGKARFVYLTENHRQEAGLIELTTGLREAILSDNLSDMTKAVNEFSNQVDTLESTGATLSTPLLDKLRSGGSVSMLFRNNGQTLKMSSDLRKRGVPHVLNTAEPNNNFSPWLTDIFSDYKKSSISEDRFLELYEEATGEDGASIWRRLQKLLHTDNDVINVRELLDAIAVSQVDDPMLRGRKPQSIIVSNIHRSKGREYDCVLVERSFVDSLASGISAEEYKTLYVAITRPKKKLLVAPMQDKSGMKLLQIFASGRKRWGKTKNKKPSYFEFDGVNDISCDMFAHFDPILFKNVNIGDHIYFERKLKNKNLEYLIIHDGTDTVLGSFGLQSPYVQDLIAYMKLDDSSLVELPATITDLYVSGIYSQVVESQYLESHPEIHSAAPNGVWKWIELVGIGHADYDVY